MGYCLTVLDGSTRRVRMQNREMILRAITHNVTILGRKVFYRAG